MRNIIHKFNSVYTFGRDYILNRTDPVFLLFILFLFNYRFSFKILALVAIYFLRPNFKIKRDGIVMFYLSLIAIGLLNLLLVNRDYSFNHVMVVLAGCCLWLGSVLVYHQVRLAVSNNEPYKIENTLKVLTVINFIVSMYDIIHIMWINHTINPYTQNVAPPFGISSGDLIGGVFGKLHLVNTVICCMLAIYFVYRQSFLFVILCLLPFLLTGSNLATLVLVGALLYTFVSSKNVLVRYNALFCLPLIIVFYIKVTPLNYFYMSKTLRNLSGLVTKQPNPMPVTEDAKREEEARKATKEELIYRYVAYKEKQLTDTAALPIKKEVNQVLNVISTFEKEKITIERKETDILFYKKDSLKTAKNHSPLFEYGQLKKFDLDKEPGKITSFKQTFNFVRSDWRYAVAGGGIGSFSSRMAFIVSGVVDDSRVFQALPHYETPWFKDNHKAIFKYLMYLDDESHSITNLPFCWYNEVLGEYGLLGCVCFLVLYLGFFVKRFRLFSYGKLLLFVILAFFLFDYWFQRLSVVILFELLMLLDLRMNVLNKTNSEQ